VEIFLTITCGVAAVVYCAIHRSRRLRDYDAIRKLNARSSARRDIKHS